MSAFTKNVLLLLLYSFGIQSFYSFV
jgi:hypothetical protein